MARQKLTDEQKELQKIENHKKQLEINLASSLKWKREQEYYPEPTIFFEVGEKIIFGQHPISEIVESYDGGKFFKIKCWGNYSVYGKMCYNENYYIVSWMDIEKFRTYEDNVKLPVFTKPEDVRIIFYNMTVSSLFSKCYSAGVDMNPSYQRELVWELEDKQQLIESIFNNVDIGKFVFHKTEKHHPYGYYEVVDGKQRLNALCEFLENKFTYNGYYYKDLSWKDQNTIHNHPVSIAELPKDTTLQQKLKVFVKMNTFGKIVSQEHLKKVSDMIVED